MAQFNHTFSHHEPCPLCNSKDNVSVYDDGFKKCRSPGCDYLVPSRNFIQSLEKQVTEDFNYTFGEYPDFLEQLKNFNRATVTKYQVSRRKSVEGASISFPYYKNGKVIACKERVLLRQDVCVWDEKNFYCLGHISNALFGSQTIEHNNDKPILITEGEMDAMSAYQMLDGEYHCLSIPSGANSAKGALAKNLELLADRKIYICFDNDEPGRIATDTAMEALSPGMAFRVNLPQDFKDAHEMLTACEFTAFRDAVRTAQPIVPKGTNDTRELMERSLRNWKSFFNSEGTFTSGYPGLDNLMIEGFRVGEVVVLAAGSGVGKSTFAFNVAHNVLSYGTKTLFLPSEMNDEDVFMLLASIKTSQRLIDMSQSDRATVDIDHIADSMESLIELLHIHRNLNGVNTKQLCDVIAFYCRAYKVKFVVLDHMHHITSDSDNYTRHLDNLAARLKEVAIECECTILSVAHTNRETGDKQTKKVDVARVRSSEGIVQNADLVLGLERDRLNTAKAVLKPLKAHRIKGIYDPIVFDFDRATLRYTESTTYTPQVTQELNRDAF